ncbi:glycoside hydrolase family 3 protein [Sediminibacillus albus]|uniref:beta-N-acetylhexosaminidase n=1 Tax=Sediminibacillus albus TaxID=407036 RepID=A0A1G8Y6Q8_9BACI|nr:glycoside hydrolase family 3 protein [Sediminibacillus albus]SDJ98559.1 beta-N-acetylhexosaminidase [Sediminibacillus albus]
MIKQRFVSFLSILLIAFLAFPAAGFANGWDAPVKPGWGDGDKAKHGWIVNKMNHMTLEEKIGQLFIIHMYGQTPTDPAYEDTNLRMNRGAKNFQEAIEKYHIGGVIYFNWTGNIGTPANPAQVNTLSNGLQEIAMNQRMPIPLFISTDQEGGIVQRLTSPGTVFPGNMALGATRSTDLAADSAAIMGTELKSLGINMNFAPVFDVNVNPANPVIGVRSFAENPDLVSELGVAQAEAYEAQKVIPTAKHFPGHGDTDVDSHYGLPIINHDLETLHEVDLKPFQAGIDAGIDAIMTAHIVVPALDDSGLPATLSKPILTDLLRDQMGFEGLIVTDSLGMSGANVVEPERVPVEAFKAGNDILLNPPNVEQAYNAMLGAVESGEISEQRVDESVYRILKAKMEKGLFGDPFTDEDAIADIGTETSLQKADEIADKSITLVKNEQDILPLAEEQSIFITGPSAAEPEYLAEQLRDKGYNVNSYATSTSPTAAQIASSSEQAAEADTIIAATYTANTNAAQQRLVDALLDTGKPVVATAIRNPYDLMAFPEVSGYLATYGNRDVSVEALARVMSGEVNPEGKLPVTIPDLYDYGYSLSY